MHSWCLGNRQKSSFRNKSVSDGVTSITESPSSIPGLSPQIRDIKGSPDGGESNIGLHYEIGGWVRTLRDQKTFAFIEISDGSTVENLQIILDSSSKGYDSIKDIHTGAAITVRGKLVASLGGKQKVELHADEVKIIGTANPSKYPLQKKRHTLEFLRDVAHLRARTNTISAVMRVRNALTAATHEFFQSNGFFHVHTPIISSSDCEGGGQIFRITATNPTKDSNNQSTNQEKEFFGKPSFLTVSGQLNAEAYACALGRVYTFGPTFRAENSNTSRHLAEFWMVEPEMAFCNLTQDISCAESYLKHCIKHILQSCPDDLAFFQRFYQKGLIQSLESIVKTGFQTITYTEAIERLKKSKMEFEYPVEWGLDLQSEHERYLTEVDFQGTPVVIRDYPKDIKAFYMKLNEDDRTVAAMDVLVPGVGELIGGSQREDSYEKLLDRMVELGLDSEEYWWYLDLRRYGSVPHSGFGLGFERLVQFVTGMENIRDVIPFPRYPDHCDF
eukprot:g4358.t1